ncbi:thioredoxin-disulfide reductase [Alkalicella caledoniensis]
MIYDMIIIGGGPGGLTAGIYGARSKLKTLIIEKGKIGGQAATTEEMENYPGFFDGTTGPGVMKKMEEHALHFGAEIVKDEVKSISLDGYVKKITTRNGEYQTKTLVISTGAEPRVLGVKGEGALRGRGVSYCATCDADFFEELDVVVVGNGDAAIEEAMYLTKFAEKVTVIVIHEEGVLDATPIIQERAFQNPKIEFVWNSVLEEIQGDEMVEGVRVKNLKTGDVSEIEVNGVFIFVGTVPKTGFLKDTIALDEKGYIITNEYMETSQDGVYAVGDVRQKFLRQVVTAAADGAIAAVAVEKYIHEEEMFKDEVIDESKPVAVLFWTPGSQECIDLVSQMEKHMDQTKVKLVKIDTYRNMRIKNRYNIKSAPSLLLFENGEVIKRIEEIDAVINFSRNIEA